MKTILITGGTGLIGTKLSTHLLAQGYKVRFLSRSKRSIPNIESYVWDLQRGQIQAGALQGVDHIVHLAGANVAEKRWSRKHKQNILYSRIKSGELLVSELRKLKTVPLSFISASAMGYYGDCGAKMLKEENPAGTDFLSKVCYHWEAASKPVQDLGIRRVLLRFPLVLSSQGGALSKMALPAKFGLGSYFGSGKQFYSWIHITDLVQLICFCLEQNTINGPLNCCSPQVPTNYEMSKAINKALGRPFIPAPIPAPLLRLLSGEMAGMLLASIRLDNSKLRASNFSLKYPDLSSALCHLFGK